MMLNGKISNKKPHIFKDRNGVWRVIPMRNPMTVWEKLCDDDMIHVIAFTFHNNPNRYFVAKYRNELNKFARIFAYELNLDIKDV